VAQRAGRTLGQARIEFPVECGGWTDSVIWWSRSPARAAPTLPHPVLGSTPAHVRTFDVARHAEERPADLAERLVAIPADRNLTAAPGRGHGRVWARWPYSLTQIGMGTRAGQALWRTVGRCATVRRHGHRPSQPLREQLAVLPTIKGSLWATPLVVICLRLRTQRCPAP